MTTFPLSQVRVLDGPFKHAQDLNIDYVRALEPDRLLAPYRVEAGLQPKAPKYPNWESTGLEGHTAGHYLTALAQIWAATGDPEMKRRLDYMVEELAACQRANGNGYVGGIPGSRQLWEEVAAGTLHVEPFAINGKWVPWYNLHKLFAGLRDAHLIGGSGQARLVLIQLADWADRLVSKLSDAQMQEMLGAEQGGMNEVLADVYALTSDAQVPRARPAVLASRAAGAPRAPRRHAHGAARQHADSKGHRVRAHRGARRRSGRSGRGEVLLADGGAAPHGCVRRQQRPRALQPSRRFLLDDRVP